MECETIALFECRIAEINLAVQCFCFCLASMSGADKSAMKINKRCQIINLSMSKEIIQLEGIVTEVLPGTTFKVKITGADKEKDEKKEEHEILAHISGRMRMHYIRILPGDKVLIEMSPYDLTKGRIVRRN